jgi:F0F1-type ATP synthase membrane subunit b/b'
MNPDLEEIGTLVSAGLAAHEVDAVSIPARHDTETHANCLNCGAARSGAYCSRCGQTGHLHRSLLHLSEEFLHGVLHFDTKGFHTLPLLFFRPGLLTRRYIEGQRTRYVSPMALFLFCIFLAYFVFSLVGEPKSGLINVKVEGAAAAKADVDQSLAEAEANLAQASKDLEAARKSGVGVVTAERAFAAASLAQKIVKLSSEAANRALKASAPSAGSTAPNTVTVADAESLKALMSESAKSLPEAPGWKGRLRKSLSNPDLLLYQLKSTAYKYSFMLIPISLPFLWLMFAWRRGVKMYDHAIFSLYSLSFMSLLLTLLALISAAGLPSVVAPGIMIVPPVHMFMQLRETYALSIFSALWRTVALLTICGTAFLLFLALVVVMVIH